MKRIDAGFCRSANSQGLVVGFTNPFDWLYSEQKAIMWELGCLNGLLASLGKDCKNCRSSIENRINQEDWYLTKMNFYWKLVHQS